MRFSDCEEFYEALESVWDAGEKERVELLLSEGTVKRSLGARIREFFSTSRPNPLDSLLVIASREGHIGLVRVLFMKGALFDSPDQWGNTGFIEASRQGNIDLCREFLRYDREYQLKTDLSGPLIRACRRNNLELLQLLLDHGANPHVIDGSSVSLFRLNWSILDSLFKRGVQFPEDILSLYLNERKWEERQSSGV